MRKYLLDFVLIMIIAAMINALLVQVISPTATLMLSPLVTLFAEILRKQAVVIYTYLLDELDKDNNVIDLRPVLQNILDKRKEDC